MKGNHIETKRKLARGTFKRHLFFFISCSLILSSCLKEEIDADRINTGAVQIQLHNFNTPLSGGSLEGTAPDIYYFKQKEDGNYVFMLTSTRYEGFQTKWGSEYVLVTTDATGVIQKTTVMKLPSKDGVNGDFLRVWDTPNPGSVFQNGNHYVADKKGFLYERDENDCWCRNMLFNLDPETGHFDHFYYGVTNF